MGFFKVLYSLAGLPLQPTLAVMLVHQTLGDWTRATRMAMYRPYLMPALDIQSMTAK